MNSKAPTKPDRSPSLFLPPPPPPRKGFKAYASEEFVPLIVVDVPPEGYENEPLEVEKYKLYPIGQRYMPPQPKEHPMRLHVSILLAFLAFVFSVLSVFTTLPLWVAVFCLAFAFLINPPPS